MPEWWERWRGPLAIVGLLAAFYWALMPYVLSASVKDILPLLIVCGVPAYLGLAIVLEFRRKTAMLQDLEALYHETAEALQAILEHHATFGEVSETVSRILDRYQVIIANLAEKLSRYHRGGAPKLEERVDVQEKRRLALEYLQQVQRGIPKKVAADLLGYSQKTLERWVRRFGLK